MSISKIVILLHSSLKGSVQLSPPSAPSNPSQCLKIWITISPHPQSLLWMVPLSSVLAEIHSPLRSLFTLQPSDLLVISPRALLPLGLKTEHMTCFLCGCPTILHQCSLKSLLPDLFPSDSTYQPPLITAIALLLHHLAPDLCSLKYSRSNLKIHLHREFLLWPMAVSGTPPLQGSCHHYSPIVIYWILPLD